MRSVIASARKEAAAQLLLSIVGDYMVVGELS